MAKLPIDYAREIAASGYGGSIDAYRGENKLQAMWSNIPSTFCGTPVSWQFECVFVCRDAICYLHQNQDTAHMLDLPQSTLKSMAMMGSLAALIYYPFGKKDVE